MSRTMTRWSLLLATLSALLVAPFITWEGATGDAPLPIARLAPHGIVVVGDSITARYNDEPGDEHEGWWNVMGNHFDAEVTTYAQSGSGYLRIGAACSGDRFVDRAQAYAGPAPSILIVEGGRNDWAFCQNGRHVVAPDAQIDHAVGRYLDILQTYLPSSTRVIVLGPPWGPLDQAAGERVTSIIRSQAEGHRMQFVSTRGTLTAERVHDGIHPNRDGSLAIARRVIHALEHPPTR